MIVIKKTEDATLNLDSPSQIYDTIEGFVADIIGDRSKPFKACIYVSHDLFLHLHRMIFNKQDGRSLVETIVQFAGGDHIEIDFKCISSFSRDHKIIIETDTHEHTYNITSIFGNIELSPSPCKRPSLYERAMRWIERKFYPKFDQEDYPTARAYVAKDSLPPYEVDDDMMSALPDEDKKVVYYEPSQDNGEFAGVLDRAMSEMDRVYPPNEVITIDPETGEEIASALDLPKPTDSIFDMKNTPLETDFEKEFLDYMLRSDSSRIMWRNYDLDKSPPELAMITYKRKRDEGSMRELRDFFRSMCKRHGKVVDQFCLSETYTFDDERCILASWRDRK